MYPLDALTLCVKEGVTRDRKVGQGNGLYGLQSILSKNKGQLVISSSGSSYMLYGEEVRTYRKLPYVSSSNGCTTVDFQLNYNSPILLEETLSFKGKTGYVPVSLRNEDIENDSGDIYYRISEKASGTGTRQSGSKLRNDILNYYYSNPRRIILDFDGIGVISSSFADELIGKLLIEMGFIEFNNSVALLNMNDTVQTIANRSIMQRIKEG